jgi:hypothetical protein
MPGFRRHLSTHRRRKPDNNPAFEDANLRPMFVQANQGPVPHIHHGDPGAENDPGLLALDQIFIWIKGEVALLIHEINLGVFDFNAGHGPGGAGPQNRFNNAVAAFKNFVNSLNNEAVNPNGNFGPTINFAEIEPIRDGSGFYTSARVVVQWQGGTHSDSSMSHVP